MKSRNKIIFINTTAGPGSTVGELIDSLALRLEQDMGWEVLIAAGRGTADFVCGNNLTHCVNALRARLLDNDGLVDPRATRRLCRWLRRQAPDLVHIHNLHGYYVDSAILFECLRELGVPVVITMHDDWLLTGHCAVIPAECTQWHRSCDKCRHASAYPAALRPGNTSRRRMQKAEMLSSLPSVTLVAPTNNLAQLVAQSHLSELPICVIPNGTSECFTQQSNVRKHPAEPARLQILAVARRWYGEKNYHALEAIASTMPEGWTIKLVGQSKREHKRIQNLGIINSPETLAELYRQSDVVICPSTNESFGLVAAEAMACGTPVVVNNLSATAEIVGADDGLAVDFSDIHTVVEAITQAARLHPATKYPLSSMATAHASLYRTLLP